MVLFTVEVYKY